jgi:protein involved in polysaccharide export with SLBB domain
LRRLISNCGKGVIQRLNRHATDAYWLAIFCLLSVFACAPTDTMRIDSGTTTPAVSGLVNGNDPQDPVELTKLEALWNARQLAGSRNEDYPIGPGDVLTISVRDVEELAHYRVRVSTRGTVELPLIGLIQAGGLSEDALAAEIDGKLQKYMYQPEAAVFVDEYHNREVAVVGAVNRPGLVLLTSPSESLLDVISQAGGLSDAAADELILIPSRPGTVPDSAIASLADSRSAGQIADVVGDSRSATDVTQPTLSDTRGVGEASHPGSPSDETSETIQSDSLAVPATISGWSSSAARIAKPGLGALPGHDDAEVTTAVARGARGATAPVGVSHDADRQTTSIDSDRALRLAGGDDAIIFKLNGATLNGAGKYVDLPMRPGDVLIVPGGGDVMVVGWVHQPGRFQVGSGLTVLGAIGAAGGPMYAAKTDSIVLIRTGQHGRKTAIPINMDQITRGQTVDLPVQANDVIDVPYSGLRIGPYIFYSILTRMGVGGPVIPY